MTDRAPIPLPRSTPLSDDTAAFVHAVREARPGHLVWHSVLAVDPATTAALGLPETDWRVHAIEFDGDELVFWARDKHEAIVVDVVRRADVVGIAQGYPRDLAPELWAAVAVSPSVTNPTPIPNASHRFPAWVVTIRLRDGHRILLQLAETHRRGLLNAGIHADDALTSLRRWSRGVSPSGRPLRG